MKSINLQVGKLLSPLSAHGVEKQLMKLNGVTAAAVNQVSGAATVTYDEGKISPAVIESAIEQCGHHCAGELTPSHLCRASSPRNSPAAITAGLGPVSYTHLTLPTN